LRADIRNARKQLREGTIDEAKYGKRIEAYMGYAIDVQEKVGLDVLVHKEPKRSDMCAFPFKSL
jgi:5-methyltetrahydropteroyltriglutamate--homocysteine methyltransferase